MSPPPTAAPSAPTERDSTADRMLAASRQGSNRAWAALLERVDPRCRALAHLLLGGHDVDEVLLSAYVRAYRARRKGGDDAEVVLLNHVWITCGHEIRRRQRREDPAPGRRAERQPALPRFGPSPLEQAVGVLGPEERAVWALHTRAGLSAERAAAALGVSVPAVAAVAERAEQRIEEAVVVATEPPTVASEDDVDLVALLDPEGAADDERDDEAQEAEGAPTEVHDLTDGAAATLGEGSLDPDPPGASFWPELGRRLRSEREALPAAPAPVLPEPGEPSPALTPAKAPPVAMQKRAPARSRRTRPDLVEELAEEADRQRAPRQWRTIAVRTAVVLLVLAAIGGVVAIAYTTASNARSPVRENAVAGLAAQSMDVLAGTDAWAASVDRTIVTDGATEETSLTVVAAPDGSYRLTDSATGRLTTYDAAFGVARDTAEGLPARDLRGLSLGAPDPSSPLTDSPIDDLGAAYRALITETDVEAEKGSRGDREVWVLRGELGDGTELTYVVDVDGLVPVELTWERDGAEVRRLEFSDVTLDADLAPFTQDLPAGSPAPTDAGFTPVALPEVEAQVDLAPPTPDYLPTGFVFTGVTVSADGRVVGLRYARGPAELLITLRPSPVEEGKVWDDPFTRSTPVEPEVATLDGGAFRTAPAQQATGAGVLASVWVADGTEALTVAGDLPIETLVEVASSIG